jgi:hypothetical protein
VSNQRAESQEICRKIKPFIWLAKFKFELSSQEQFGQKTDFVEYKISRGDYDLIVKAVADLHKSKANQLVICQ